MNRDGKWRGRQLQPIKVLRWWIVALAVLLAAISIWLTTTWLLHEAEAAPENQKAQVRIDAIRTGLTVGLGAGGAFVLLLGARRQWLNERSQSHAEGVALRNEFDATERRITELYSKAVDQLGSERPTVRLGAFYSLERLAQNYATHRQMIVDVMCGYLRMPSMSSQLGGEQQTDEGPATTENAAQELQVRLTAQRILTEHLRGGFTSAERDDTGVLTTDGKFWQGISIDLRGAVLDWWDWTGFTPAIAMFHNATFTNGANFAHSNFTTDTWFTDVKFNRHGHFHNTDFRRRVIFSNASSEQGLNLKKCRFHGMTWFEGLADTDSVKLDGALAKVDFDGNWGTGRGWPASWMTSAGQQIRSDGQWVEVVQVAPTSGDPGDSP